MEWLKKSGEFISPKQSETMIDNFSKSIGKGTVTSIYFSRDKVRELLQEEDAVGIRIYFAANDDGTQTVILKAVNASGQAIDNKILETGAPCPPYC